MSNDKQTAQQFVVQKIYVKDLSFESPNAAGFFSQQQVAPEINLQLNTESQQLAEQVYEIMLSITVTAKVKEQDTVMYIAELKQAGIFTMANFSEEEMPVLVNTHCPSILFPYAREAVSSMVERGGFPQLLLAPINFDALYQQHLQQAKQTAAPSESKH